MFGLWDDKNLQRDARSRIEPHQTATNGSAVGQVEVGVGDGEGGRWLLLHNSLGLTLVPEHY